MDRPTFLSKLLEEQNRVRVGEGSQDCFICKESFGEPSDGDEEVEYQVRLPCHEKHTIGSRCITKWLKQHNTCPICSTELFSVPSIRSKAIQALHDILYILYVGNILVWALRVDILAIKTIVHVIAGVS